MAEPQDEQPLPAETVEPPDAPEAAAAAGTDALLDLTAEVVTAATPEARRAIERDLAEAFEAAPSHDNLLRLPLVMPHLQKKNLNLI